MINLRYHFRKIEDAHIRRSLRIFPLYFVVVLVCLAAGTAFSLPPYQWSQIWSYVVYLQNVVLAFWPASIGGPQHFWSLAVEEQFYLFWPLAVFWLSRRQLLWLAMFLVLAAWGARAACLQVSWDCAFFFTFCRVDTLAVGALLAIFFSEPARWQPIAVWTRRLAVPIVLVVAATYVGVAGNPGRFFADTRSTVYAMFFGAVLVWSLSPGAFNPLPGVFRGSWLRGLGRISYGMYVFHPFIFHKIMGRFYAATWSPVRGHLWASLTVEWFVCLGGTILVAWTSWVFFEHPFIRLKHRFEYETGVPASLSKVGATEPGKP